MTPSKGMWLSTPEPRGLYPRGPHGVVEGTTENATVVIALLTDLADRGLDASEGLLLVVDGGKGIGTAIRSLFGQSVAAHHCHRHKERNVRSYTSAMLKVRHLWRPARS